MIMRYFVFCLERVKLDVPFFYVCAGLCTYWRITADYANFGPGVYKEANVAHEKGSPQYALRLTPLSATNWSLG